MNRLELLQECRLVDCRPGQELTLLPLSWHPAPVSLLHHWPRLGTVFVAS